jgi:hypothetical protein
MVKVEVIEKFTLKEFNKIKNLKRGTANDKYGELYITDTFECDEEMAKYLTGNNALNKVVVKVIEVEPEEVQVVENEIVIDEEKDNILEKPKKKKHSKK